MNKKLLYGIIGVLAVIVIIFLTFPFGMILALTFWIYVGVMFRKRKHLFQHKMEPQLAEKLLKSLKVCMIIAIVSFPIAIGGIIMHNVQYSLSETEEHLYFFIGIFATYIFVLASSAGAWIYFSKDIKNLYKES